MKQDDRKTVWNLIFRPFFIFLLDSHSMVSFMIEVSSGKRICIHM